MKVLFITSILSPDIGGPALYAKYLPPEIEKSGIRSDVVYAGTFSYAIKLPILFFLLLIKAPGSNILYSLSASPAINLPTIIISKIFRKKFIMRPGGDFLWERATQAGETEENLPDYYERGTYLSHKTRARVFSFILGGADKIIFPTVFLKDVYQKYFGVATEKCEIVDYPFPDLPATILDSGARREKTFLFAGRLVPFKNAERLVKAFLSIKEEHGFTLKIMGSGSQKTALIHIVSSMGGQNKVVFADSLPHEEFLREIKKSWCVLIPSTFEPGSFFLLECLKLKTPIIFTRYGGLAEGYKDTLLFVDPYSVDDIKEKIEFVMREDHHNAYISSIENLSTQRNWSDVAREHIKIFQKL